MNAKEAHELIEQVCTELDAARAELEAARDRRDRRDLVEGNVQSASPVREAAAVLTR